MSRTLWLASIWGLLTLSSGAAYSWAQELRSGAPAPAPTQAVKFELTGVWAGVGYLDEEKLKQKLATMTTEAQKQAFLASANRFLSAAAAFHFKANGQYESDFEIQTENGEIDRAATVGTFKILEAAGPKLVVEITEKVADGKTETEKKLLQFYDDGEHIAILVAAPPELADCNPLLVCERVPAEQLATPDEIAKQQSSKTQIK